MLKTMLVIVSFCLAASCYAQNTHPARYKDICFSNITIDKNLSYAANIPVDVKPKYYSFDIYQPAGDSITTKRPLIIWMHGGGFKFSSKSATGIEMLCKSFAQKGYVCASINYRLSKKNTLTNVKNMLGACSNALQDVNTAISFFIKNHERFGIDTNRIVLGGNSAGGILALQYVYSNTDLALLQDSNDVVIHPLNYTKHHVAAIINFWGALVKISWLTNARVPIISAHGSKDRIIPIGKTNSSFYGSLAIKEEADKLGISNRLKIFEGYSHELQKHFNPFFSSAASKQRWLEAGRFATDFLYEELYQ